MRLLLAALISFYWMNAVALTFSAGEKARIVAHGPWPPPPKRDTTNRVSGHPAAVAFGERLFYEPRLSGTGSVLCASCHVPARAFQDARQRAFGLQPVARNTPSLVNVGLYRWYGWDGAHDSLWAQSIRPMLEPREMRASPAHVAAVVRERFAADYQRAFGHPVPAGDDEVLADAGKALAAFQETLVSGRTPFDDFRDALERGDKAAAARYPAAALRGLALFVGKGGCDECHAGPHFTTGEFAKTGVALSSTAEDADGGRLDGIKRLKSNPYNLLGRFNDDPSVPMTLATREARPLAEHRGEFRVPGLRNVALTAPYMHDGSLATLSDVVRRYAELRHLNLTPRESEDLVVFLQSLTERTEPK